MACLGSCSESLQGQNAQGEASRRDELRRSLKQTNRKFNQEHMTHTIDRGSASAATYHSTDTNGSEYSK